MRTRECMDTNQERLLKRISEVCFAADEMQLFLDTHPECQEGICFFKQVIKERKELLERYAQLYGALTMDTFDNQSCDNWKWVEMPFPWE